ncbi:sensor histidine kinase [Saccharopolyspora shandongensis]|uniref:histidine kinase n=1 Tax=Saccharopolyspora shandongensis TaxID=418495 RepID=A0A1H3EPA9_9PSEU|nr:sensor histidine kinase [Saccharopolyspora shandongensis]SDX80435.1 Signal transduction histidine kinase [Saccharopolyspora shandongensis]
MRSLIANFPGKFAPDEQPNFVGTRPAWLARVPRWVILAVISGCVFVLSVWSTVLNNPDHDLEMWWQLATGLVGSLALLWMRRFPATVALAATVTHLATPFYLGGYVAQYALGAYGRKRWQIWGTAAVSIVASPAFLREIAAFSSIGNFAALVIMMSLLNLFPLVVGLYMAGRRARLAHWVERAERAEREQALIAERTRGEERARIAREMHDSIAHQVSLVVVHAGALELLAERDPAKAARAAATIQEVGRGALNELRQMIGVLRSDPSDQRPEPPQPTLQDVEALVSASSDAGLAAELRVDGDRRRLPDHVERAAYRVIQEALTNVHKHAGGSQASVALSYRPENLEISVRNSRPAEGFERSLPSGGQGLIGLAERVQLAGGDIDSGPLPDGGFRVTATLPAS